LAQFVDAGVDVHPESARRRPDAVNVLDADAAVVTSVDLRLDYLGDTREKIGFEKAGICAGARRSARFAPPGSLSSMPGAWR
jgi:dihydrofolate synthase/folylpolyglutamate synthase